ncbi:MAG: 50S ribosomal protein L18 [Candidatus Berkelbacteria bacterium]|nr:50S ribosomal protein L18 [Candidatus Berkelbacteria bacterium]
MKDERAKLKVMRSLNGINAQLIYDSKTVVGRYFKNKKGEKPSDQSFKFGETFGELIQKNDFNKISFDRGKSHYHGRVKMFAEGLRKSGIQF